MAHTSPAPTYVYGDSTPFDAGFDFIATVRSVVSCGVALMKAQHAIDCARARVAEAEEHAARTRQDLEAMADAVDDVLAQRPARPTVRDVALRIATMSRGAVALEVRRAQSALEATVVRADRTMVESRKTAGGALGEVLAAREMPAARGGLRLFALERGYGAEATIALPCGLRATFDCALPADHPLAKPLRVRDLRRELVVALPARAGWLRRRTEVRPTRLDGLTVLGASIDGARGALLLGKNLRAGVLHAFDVDVSGAKPRAHWRDGDDRRSHDLGPADAGSIAAVLRAIDLRARTSPMARGAMTEALLDGRPLAEHDPGDVCARLVGAVGPLAREVARRSGAPGEMVLRRNIDAGHRDEIFVTTAELQETVNTLPPSLRRAFAPLGLEGLPRSRRAPPRSMPAYEEVSVADFVSVS